MGITTKENNSNSFVTYVSFTLLLTGIGSAGYMFYRASDFCRILEHISSDVQMNAEVRSAMFDYLNVKKVQIFIRENLGDVFYLDELSVEFPHLASFQELDVYPTRLQLVVKTDRTRDEIRNISNLSEVGVGFSRGYLMFESNTDRGSGAAGKFNIGNNSYVNCRAYDD